MSDFLIYAARLQDDGINALTITLGLDNERVRIMLVSPHGGFGHKVQQKYPVRTFELCGTDRVLEKLKDDMSYSDDGMTAEKVQQAINAHPILADDLREWYADMLRNPMPTQAEIDAAAETVTDADVQRSQQYVNGLLRGFDAARSNKAMRG